MIFDHGTEPIAAAERIPLAATPLAVLSYPTRTIEQLTEIFDDGFGVLGAAIADGLFVPTGPPVAVYRGDPMATFDLLIGFPVARPMDAAATHSGMTVEPAVVPAGDAWVQTHVGTYDGLGTAWGDLVATVTAAGSTPSGTWIEVYVSPPSDPEDRLRTDLVLPVSR